MRNQILRVALKLKFELFKKVQPYIAICCELFVFDESSVQVPIFDFLRPLEDSKGIVKILPQAC